MLLIPIGTVFADEELPIISINFLSGDTIDLDESPQMLRAEIEIENYNPQDGYHFMQIIRLNDGEIIKDTEIMPKVIDDDVYGVQVLHYLEQVDDESELIGDYGFRVYSEYGPSEAVSTFSIIKSSMPIVTSGTLEQLETIEDTTEEITEDSTEEITEELVVSESKIPSWVHDIFVWYANETISETELLSALEYLISQGTIDVNLS
ncbi:hypothetical protein [Nitrosopumilus sp.]|uniref:hypothetical protein n=1 Tax=Nitrosopumilus sp. TaxID=2024843 RepID=UPI00262876BF|nr:hypothetical protein [Nitrosopumilus sp.]